MENNKNEVTLLSLFLNMFLISTFTFGGGFVIISMIQKKFADELHWIQKEEILDMTAIAQSAPGPLAVNTAVIVGYRLKGILGSIVAVLGTIIPPIIIISLITFVYDTFANNLIVQTALKVTRAAVAAIIIDVVIDLGKNLLEKKNILNILLMIGAFVASFFFKISSIQIILFFLVFGILLSFMKKEETL